MAISWILKEALEAAGAADKLKVAEAIRNDEPDRRPGRAIASRDRSSSTRRAAAQNVPMIFAQWQKGVPVTVFPDDLALAKPFWPKS